MTICFPCILLWMALVFGVTKAADYLALSRVSTVGVAMIVAVAGTAFHDAIKLAWG